jgi:uracil-DNA glycosylase
VPWTKDPPQAQFGAKAAAAAALRWWVEAGVNSTIDETAHDRFATSPAPQQRESLAATAAPRPIAAPDVAATDARDLAASSPDLETLRLRLNAFEGCALKRTATQLVFADGVPGSAVMFVGEAPGGEEDRIGRPFVGRAGRLLDRMLSAIGLDRSQVYIANVVPWRPPGNRTPTLQETQACLPFIRRQIDLANPQVLVCLGGSAAETLLGIKGGIMRARGAWTTYRCENGRQIPALAMLHPAYLLRQPGHKKLAWADMRALASAIDSESLSGAKLRSRDPSAGNRGGFQST